jgi:hypothetical protein
MVSVCKIISNLDWTASLKKPKRKIKTIIKKPVFNVIPYNMHWMDKIMTKIFPGKHLGNHITTQTVENIENEITEKEIIEDKVIENKILNVKIEPADINPYKSISHYNTGKSR